MPATLRLLTDASRIGKGRAGSSGWTSSCAPTELANATFEWIEAFYNPIRRRSDLGYLSQLEHERRHTAGYAAA